MYHENNYNQWLTMNSNQQSVNLHDKRNTHRDRTEKKSIFKTK